MSTTPQQQPQPFAGECVLFAGKLELEVKSVIDGGGRVAKTASEATICVATEGMVSRPSQKVVDSRSRKLLVVGRSWVNQTLASGRRLRENERRKHAFKQTFSDCSVFFAGNFASDVYATVTQLGGEIVDDASDATICVATLEIASRKVLESCTNVPVVRVEWILDSENKKSALPPREYIFPPRDNIAALSYRELWSLCENNGNFELVAVDPKPDSWMACKRYGKRCKASMIRAINNQPAVGASTGPKHRRLMFVGDKGAGKSYCSKKLAEQAQSKNIALTAELDSVVYGSRYHQLTSGVPHDDSHPEKRFVDCIYVLRKDGQQISLLPSPTTNDQRVDSQIEVWDMNNLYSFPSQGQRTTMVHPLCWSLMFPNRTGWSG